MNINLKNKSLLTLKEYTKNEIEYLLDLAEKVKEEKHKGIYHQRFLGMSLAMIFEKRSTRTRCSFETAFGEEGGSGVFLSTDDIQLGGKETVEDTARVLGRMFDAIEFRGYKQKTVETLAEYSNVPVYNGLTDSFHPTQVLADLLTLKEHFGRLEDLNFTYIGDGRNNMAKSLAIGCAKMKINYTIISPKELWPEDEYIDEIKKMTEKEMNVTDDIGYVKGSDVLYTDVWVSMGEESLVKERSKILSPYQVNSSLIETADNDKCIFMHCLPAIRGMEVTNEVIEGNKSLVWDQAENRKHTIKALMLATLGKVNPQEGI